MTFSAAQRAREINEHHAGLPPAALLRLLTTEIFPGRIALVSSFGAEAAILLHFAALADKAFPVVFLDTQKLFPETLEYRDTLIAHFGLTNVKTIYPDYADTSRSDPDGTLWESDGRACCTIRKVLPLARALKPYDAWITGRKRFHGGTRTELPFAEASDGKVKINPLANWGAAEIKEFFEANKIPRHPLGEKGYTSIGCLPCTEIPKDGADPRSGRFSGQGRSECGIHLEGGKFVRTNVT